MKKIDKFKEYLRNKLRVWLGIEEQYQVLRQNTQDIQNILDLYEVLNNIIKERTEYHLDVHRYSNSQVILIGKYAKRDFVKIYDIPDRDFNTLREYVRDLNKYAKRGKIDAWPMLECVFEREGL